MKIAIIGGTHGNEPVGIEVINILRKKPYSSKYNSYECFHGNPEAYELKKRYVDSDLNRAFGKNGNPKGVESKRSLELKDQISGKFDLTIDLHTTTTNMGLTVILNNTCLLTRQVSCYLKHTNSEIQLIEEDILDGESTHLNRLAPAGITIEVGPVANNVITANLVQETYKMILSILDWNFQTDEKLLEKEYFKTFDTLFFPDEEGWYVHKNLEQNDFCELRPGDPVFENIDGKIKTYEGKEVCYPFFINEAAYLENKMAMVLAYKKRGFLQTHL